MFGAHSLKQTGASSVRAHGAKNQMSAAQCLVILAAAASSYPAVQLGPWLSRTGVAMAVADVQLVILHVCLLRQSLYRVRYWNCGHQKGHNGWRLKNSSLWIPVCAHALVPGIGHPLQRLSCCITERDRQVANLTPLLWPMAVDSLVGSLTVVCRCRQPASSGHQ